jgi:hypothetical protein
LGILDAPGRALQAAVASVQLAPELRDLVVGALEQPAPCFAALHRIVSLCTLHCERGANRAPSPALHAPARRLPCPFGGAYFVNADTEINQRLAGIDRMIHVALQACGLTSAAPHALCECMERLDRQATEATRTYLLTSSEQGLADALTALESTSQQACAMCARARGELAHMVSATLDEACREIRDLRRQLHGAPPA